MKRRCVNDLDYFCYIFREYIFGGERMAITELIKQRYYSYFQLKVGDEENVHKMCYIVVYVGKQKVKKKEFFVTHGLPRTT